MSSFTERAYSTLVLPPSYFIAVEGFVFNICKFILFKNFIIFFKNKSRIKYCLCFTV